jgi:hypothetical protein
MTVDAFAGLRIALNHVLDKLTMVSRLCPALDTSFIPSGTARVRRVEERIDRLLIQPTHITLNSALEFDEHQGVASELCVGLTTE